MNNRVYGRIGEESAALYLEERGWHILEKNRYVGHDEIDLIAENDTTLLFVEVKTRRQTPGLPDRYGKPASAVNDRKRACLIRAADGYLREHPTEKTVRFDVIEIYADPHGDTYRVLDIRQYENAVRKSGKFSYAAYKKSGFREE